MVTATARLLVLFGCTLLFSAITSRASASTLELAVDKPTLELGKPLTLTLTWDALSPSLETANLEALRRDFYVSAPPAAEKLARQQRWTLRLYAYTSGEFVLPALRFGTSSTRPVTVHVTPAIDPKDKTVIEMTTHISTTTPWLKQQVSIAAQFVNTTPIVVLTTQEPSTPAAQIQGFTPTQTEVSREPASRYRHTLGWHVYPLRQGEQHLGPFMVFYQRDGIRTHQFVLRPIILDVTPLPAYLPATIPVGRLTLEPVTLPWWRLTGRLGEMHWRLHATDMLEADIPDLTQQIASTTVLHFHAAQETRQRQSGMTAVMAQHDYRIPFTATAQGIQSYPAMRLQYFDPDLSRLQTLTYPASSFITVHGWLAVIVLLALLWNIYYLSRRALRWLRRYWRCVQGYRAARRMLAEAKSARDIRVVLQRVAQAEGWPVNMTLGDWQVHWHRHNPGNKMQMHGLQLLTTALYSNQTVDINQIRHNLQPLVTRQAVFQKAAIG